MLVIRSDVKVLHHFFMRIVTRMMGKIRQYPIKTAYPSPQAVDIIFKFHWKPEMKNIMAQSAAVQDVKQLAERHITVVCQNKIKPIYSPHYKKDKRIIRIPI